MRKLQYGVAVSLDGYIAGPAGEADWIEIDPGIDFADIWGQFDTLLMGRRTYEAAAARLGSSAFAGRRTIVFSRQLLPGEHRDVTIVSEIERTWVQSLKREAGKDIWLMGGAEIFRSLLDLGEVDLISTMIIPVLLGGGTPLMPAPYSPTKLRLSSHRIYPNGTISAVYEVRRDRV